MRIFTLFQERPHFISIGENIINYYKIIKRIDALVFCKSSRIRSSFGKLLTFSLFFLNLLCNYKHALHSHSISCSIRFIHIRF